jgi:hypothetical protein
MPPLAETQARVVERIASALVIAARPAACAAVVAITPLAVAGTGRAGDPVSARRSNDN